MLHRRLARSTTTGSRTGLPPRDGPPGDDEDGRDGTERTESLGEFVAGDAASLVAEGVHDRRLVTPAWIDVVHWSHALADDGVRGTVVDAAAESGVVAGGDWVAGEARVHAALRSGLEAADRLGWS